jgi:cell division protein FtsN
MISPSPVKTPQKAKQVRSLSSLSKSLLVTAVIIGGTVFGSYFFTGSGFPLPYQQRDNISPEQQQERLAAFDALGAMQMMVVPQKDIAAAVDGMQLSPEAKQALMADLAGTRGQAAQHSAAPAASKEASPQPRFRLVWITLWDTDVEDGDVVRIDSQGYSRTVVLKKAPTTFAVPVPGDGIISVTGIRDGDGGGITVGLASGESKAVFPVMSEGQVLGLRVKAK